MREDPVEHQYNPATALLQPTTIILQDGHMELSLSIEGTGHPLDIMIDKMIKPILLAMGYQQCTVDMFLGVEGGLEQ